MEEYTIQQVKGFVVSNQKYYSKVFDSIEEAQAHKEKIEASPVREETKTIKYKGKNDK